MKVSLHNAEIASHMRKLGSPSVLERCDVDQICDRLGIPVSRLELSGLHGSVVGQRDGLEILINSKDSATRQRFTLAHELAHILLGHIQDGKPLHRQESGDAPTAAKERECDAFGAELLMPRPGYQALIQGCRPGIAKVAELAERYDVSLQSSAVRLAQLSEIPCRVIVWYPSGNVYERRWSTGSQAVPVPESPLAAHSNRLGVASAAQSGELITKLEEVNSVKCAVESKAFGAGVRRYVMSVLTTNPQIRHRKGFQSHGSRPRRW